MKAVAFDCCAIPDLVSLFRGRDLLPADDYPFMAENLEAFGVTVHRETYQEKVLKIFKGLPPTQDLALLPEFEEPQNLELRICAQARGKAAGIPNKFCPIEACIEALRECRLEDDAADSDAMQSQ